MAKVPLSLIREFYEAAQAKWPDQPRSFLVGYAYGSAKLEMREGERAEAELAEGLYDLASEKDGSPEDDYPGELPW